jgi:VanZ family protein
LEILRPGREIVLFKRIRKYRAQWHWQQHLALIFLGLWGLFIVYGTMLPFDFSASRELIQWRLQRLAARPLRGLGTSWNDVFSNVLFFVPWGFLLAVWRVSRKSSGLNTMTLALLSGACLSGCVEVMQLFAPQRSTSVIDLLTNTFGSVVGAMAGWLVVRGIWPIASVRIRQLLLSRPLTTCALAAAAGLLIAGLSPSYDNGGMSGIGDAFRKARLMPFGPSSSGVRPADKAGLWGAELLVWMLAGGLIALAARESGHLRKRAVAIAIALSTGLGFGIEVMQLAIPGRDVDLTSVLLAAVGSALGSLLVARRDALEARQWVAPALGIWALSVLLSAWNPLNFTWPAGFVWQPEMIVPFWSYFDSRALADLTDVIGQATAFLPLGALLAARSWRQSFWLVVVIGFSYGMLLECGQVFLPTRSPDVSDALSAAAGAGVGLAVWRWGESVRTSSSGATRYRIGPRTGPRGA